MPELPEVETIKTDLKGKITGKKITGIEIIGRGSVKSDPEAFEKVLKGNSFKDIGRLGKIVVFSLEKGSFLLIHLKMTGQLIYEVAGKTIAGGHPEPKVGRLPNSFTRAYFTFEDGSKLFFNDIRRFGYLKITDEEEFRKIEGGYGIDALSPELNEKKLKEIFDKRKKAVKAVLMEQELIAGIGNIYADEILFEAGVKPQRPAGSITDEEIKKIREATPKILRIAVENRGTTFRDYVDANGGTGRHKEFLKVYGREGEPCGKCKGKIKLTRVAGRSTRYCDICQK